MLKELRKHCVYIDTMWLLYLTQNYNNHNMYNIYKKIKPINRIRQVQWPGNTVSY